MEPAGTSSRHEDSSESRQEIIKAAAELFMEFGYAASTIDAVADRLAQTWARSDQGANLSLPSQQG